MTKQITDTNLQFIREKIYSLRSAIMYSMSNELIKIPNNIINVLRIDDEGNLWFHCKAPVQYIREYEQIFPVRLHFYRKGVLYFIEVSGSAKIVQGQQNDYMNFDAGKEEPLLIKMNIHCAEYAEPETRNKTWIDLMMENAYKWLIRTMAVNRGSKSIFAKLHQAIHE